MKSIREIAEEIAEGWTNEEYHNAKLADRIEKALRDRDDRAAKIADERAAFNRRLAATRQIGDPMADLKFTRADEAEIIAGEIREGVSHDSKTT